MNKEISLIGGFSRKHWRKVGTDGNGQHYSRPFTRKEYFRMLLKPNILKRLIVIRLRKLFGSHTKFERRKTVELKRRLVEATGYAGTPSSDRQYDWIKNAPEEEWELRLWCIKIDHLHYEKVYTWVTSEG